MIKKKITNFEVATLNYFVTRAFLVGVTFNALINVMKRDSWVIPLASIPLDILFVIIINKIIDYEPDLTLPQKLLKLFGKNLGKIIIVLICLFDLIMGILKNLYLSLRLLTSLLSSFISPLGHLTAVAQVDLLFIIMPSSTA